MRLGLISDVHGNVVALRSVLEDMPPVDGLVCAGDVVGYNPWPAECIEELRARAVPTVMGNHDRAVAGDSAFGFNGMARAGVDYTRDVLTAEDVAWLGDLPERLSVVDGRVKVVHGHPDDPDRYTYTHEFGPELLGDEEVLVLGHTHVQGHVSTDEGLVVNPGSVGQPRDGDPKAAYAVLDLDAGTVDERRVAYDVDRVVEAVETVGLPRKIGTRLRDGR